MRRFYLYQLALQVNSVAELEAGINNLNEIYVNRNAKQDVFICNSTIWECDTTQGFIYELFGGIISEELQRVVPKLFESFTTQEAVYNDHNEFDSACNDSCNGFLGFKFDHTAISNNRRVFNMPSYEAFVLLCLKYGARTIAQLRVNLSVLFPNYSFEDRAINDVDNWLKNDIEVYNKLLELLDDIPRNPFTGGLGKTEVLKKKGGMASKRITQGDRITYSLSGSSIKIFACSGHYD